MGFNIESLENGIEASKKNIITFEEAIKKEREIQEEYREMIKVIERKEREASMVIKIKAEREEY